MECCDENKKVMKSNKPNKKFWFITIIVIAGLIFLLVPKSNIDGSVVSANKVTIYKSYSCGCCSIYSKYLKSKNFDVEEINMNDISGIKNEQGVPSGLESCHTAIIGEYFVEGHIPLEAVEKLLSERPDIRGIAMPGMPSGSPGMPGQKHNDFVIYSVDHDGNYDEFMRI